MRVLLLIVFAVSSMAAQINPQPLEYFLKDSDYLDVALYPSGERIAARAQFDGKVVLIVMDRRHKREASSDGSVVWMSGGSGQFHEDGSYTGDSGTFADGGGDGGGGGGE